MKPIEHAYSWEAVSAVRRERIEAGEHALERIDRHETFRDWHAIGAALVEMQTEAMRQAGANRPIGKGYNAAFAMLAYHNPKLGKVDKATRSHAIWMAEHWAAVEEWHALLPENVRRLVNHPATVHRRFDRDHPLPRKTSDPNAARTAAGFNKDDEDENENGESEDDGDEAGDGEAFGIGEGGSPSSPRETREDWLTAVETALTEVIAVLRRAPAQWRATAVSRIVNALDALGEDDESIDDVDEEIAEHEARETQTVARSFATTPSQNEPTSERIAQIAAEVQANPLPEGDDVFAGLGDDLGAGQAITAERVRARRPKLSLRHAAVIAARLNHPDWDDAEVAKLANCAVSVVRRVLDANGFKQSK